MSEPESNADKVRKLLESMVEIDESIHDDFLREQAGADNRLRQFVESVVQAGGDEEDTSGSLIDRVLRKDTPQAIVGQRIGGFEVLELLGVEGLNSVFAVQGPQGTKLQLQLMRLGLTTAAARERFRVWVDAVLAWRHPAFPTVLAAGSWEEPNSKQHLPWFVVGPAPRSRALDRFVAEEKLSLEDLLERFQAVVDAVHDSHQSGLLHRLLQPTLLRVDGNGELSILELGVAHATHADLVGLTMQARTGDVLRTTRYFAPEQLARDSAAIDTRTDVFALGVILFELLSGDLPYPEEGSLDQRAAAIRASDPPRPGRRRKPYAGRRRDLDALVQRAIHGDPARRYGSVAELAEDLRRYRLDQPLRGVAEGDGRGRRFLRRHRFLVGSTLAVLLILIASSTLLALRTGQLREALSAERETVQRGERVAELLAPSAARPGMSVRDSIDVLRERVDTLRDAPLVEAAARLALGRALGVQGDLDPALAQIDAALALYREHLGPDHLETLRGERARALVRAAQGQGDAARVALRDGLARLQKSGVQRPHEEALFQFYLADCAIRSGDHAEAEGTLAAAIAAWRVEPNRDRELATALARLGDLHRARKQPEAAIGCYREAQAVLARRRDDRTVLAARIDRSLGDVHAARGAHRAAITHFRAAAQQFDKTLGADGLESGLARLRLAQSLAAEFELREARAALELALPACNFHLQATAPDLIAARRLMSACLRAENRGAEAVKFARAAFAGAVARHGDGDPAVAPDADELADALRDAGDWIAAEAHCRARLAVREQQPESLDRTVRILRAKNDLAMVLIGRRRFVAARALCEEVLAIAPSVLPQDHALWSSLLRVHGRSLVAVEEYEKSERELVEALTRAQRAFGPEHEEVRGSLRDLVELYDAWGRPEDAENYRRRLGRK